MKKLIIVAVCALLIYGIAFFALTNAEMFELIQHPQTPVVAENGVATYTVKCKGKDVIAQWFMNWNGQTYKISDISDTKQEWEAYAGTAYGPKQVDENTFSYVFEGIGAELDGAHIWCVLHCGNLATKTQAAVVDIDDVQQAPVIVEVPIKTLVMLGDEMVVSCEAQSPDGNGQLSYQWYETISGKLEDIKPLEAESAKTDTLSMHIGETATKYYVCRVETSEGGVAYSSVIRVTITDGITFDENEGSNFYDFIDNQDVVVEKAKESGKNYWWIVAVAVLLFGFGYSVYSFQKRAKEEA